MDLQKTTFQQTIDKLEKEKSVLENQLEEERKKIEDLQFNYEEESITKSEIQVRNLIWPMVETMEEISKLFIFTFYRH